MLPGSLSFFVHTEWCCSAYACCSGVQMHYSCWEDDYSQFSSTEQHFRAHLRCRSALSTFLLLVSWLSLCICGDTSTRIVL